MALPFRLMCIVAASLLIALDRANGLQDSYVKRVLGANEMCVNVTRPMGGNTLCPIPAFKVVKDIVYAKQMDAALDMISKAFPAITQECQKTITNLICAMYEATCSADEKYEVRLVNYQDCIDYLSCTPNKILPEGSKIGGLPRESGRNCRYRQGTRFLRSKKSPKQPVPPLMFCSQFWTSLAAFCCSSHSLEFRTDEVSIGTQCGLDVFILESQTTVIVYSIHRLMY